MKGEGLKPVYISNDALQAHMTTVGLGKVNSSLSLMINGPHGTGTTAGLKRLALASMAYMRAIKPARKNGKLRSKKSRRNIAH